MTTTLHGIAYQQLQIAQEQLDAAMTLAERGHTHEAVEQVSTTIRQLEAARRHLS